MDYVNPNEAVATIALAGGKKANLSKKVILIGAILSGALLGFATTLALTASTQTGLDIVGAILFPTSFVMILLLNLELVTGSFAILPIAYFRKETTLKPMIHNLSWAFIGNLIGGLLYAALFSISVTSFGTVTTSPLIEKIILVAENKTLFYQSIGAGGLVLVFVKAILCNWMVALGAIMSFMSKSTIGKITAMWLPILIFFAQGFEHAVVNMSIIPIGMLIGADIGMADWWLWNLIPVTIGNFIGAFLFVALPLHYSKTDKI
ncbi:putative formate transporter 1 [Jeotgalibaca dankookensis]|uniref:Putative formate transporter 1 n=1 Tax=Jeotgalibaca dankookensis TaxID=708126 RepID=A0A1S6INM9_9LACT|nr:formate/nitrite transporter family protein [Jeotgalibaca dankookensis]AQS53141.1 putative formate transporter 1 [Jeotgalibaca dankookensis]